jgi:hypothetical protein
MKIDVTERRVVHILPSGSLVTFKKKIDIYWKSSKYNIVHVPLITSSLMKKINIRMSKIKNVSSCFFYGEKQNRKKKNNQSWFFLQVKW